MNTGFMNVQCIGEPNEEACYNMAIISLSTRQIKLMCGDPTYRGLNQDICNNVNIVGPVYPFPDGTTKHTFGNMYNDSIVFDFNDNVCQEMAASVPFAGNQVTLIDQGENSHVYYDACGYDLPLSGIHLNIVCNLFLWHYVIIDYMT